MQRIIALDVDDTLADLVPEWLRRHSVNFGEFINPENILDWNIQKYCKYDIFSTLKEKNLYDGVKPIKNSLIGVKLLRKYGRVIFITSAPIEQAGRKFLWLKEHGFDPKKEDYFEASDKSVFRVDYIVDDNADTIDRQSKNEGTKAIVFTRPWNKYYHSKYRVNDWKDLIQKWRIYESGK